MIPPYIWFALSGLGMIVSSLMWVRTRRAGQIIERNRAWMEEARALMVWAKWTTLSIATQAGQMYTTTVWDLRSEPTMMVWKEPIAVSLHQGAPVDAELYEGERTDGRPDTGPGLRPAGPLPVRRPQASGHTRAGAQGQDEPPGEGVQPQG